MFRLKDLPDRMDLDAAQENEALLTAMTADEACPACGSALFYDGAALRNGIVPVRIVACSGCEFVAELPRSVLRRPKPTTDY